MDFRMNVIHLETFIRVFIGLYILDSQEKIREEKIIEDKGREPRKPRVRKMREKSEKIVRGIFLPDGLQ